MRSVIATILVLVLSFPLVMKFSMVVNYYTHLDYYKTELCENQDKPELQCNGTCHLKKEIAEDTNQEQEKPVELINVEISAFTLNTSSVVSFNLFEVVSKKLFSYSQSIIELPKSVLFSPPEF